MGKKGNWFSAVKAALNSEPKEGNSQQSEKSKKKWFKKRQAALNTIPVETAPEATTVPPAPILLPVVPYSEQSESSGVDKEHPEFAHAITIVEPENLSGVDKEHPILAYAPTIAEPEELSGVDTERPELAYAATVVEPENLSGVDKEHPELAQAITIVETEELSGVDEEHPILAYAATIVEPEELKGVDKEHPELAYAATIVEPEKLSEVEKEQADYAYNVALAGLATDKASEASAAVMEVVSITAGGPLTDENKEELAAIKVQTAFRGYMARRTLRAIRGLVRLKSLMQGQAVKQQTASTLKCVQTLARMQSQIRERRLRIAEDNLASQFKQKKVKAQAKDLGKLQLHGNGWNSSGKTKDDIEAKLQSKHEAAIRRERTLAYSFSHQQTWKASGMSASKMFMDPNNPRWGWSWLERCLDTKPIESTNKSSLCTKQASGNEILKAYAQRHNAEKRSVKSARKHPPFTSARLSTSARPKLISPNPKMGRDNDDVTSTRSEKSVRDGKSVSSSLNVPTYKAPTKAPNVRLRSTSARPKLISPIPKTGLDNDDVTSTRSEQSVGDDKSVSSSLNVPTNMTPTKGANVRLRLTGEAKRDKSVTLDISSVSSAKKRVSRPLASATSRRSSISAADASSISDHTGF